MPLQKTKNLGSGVSGNHWAVSSLRFVRKGMRVDMVWSLYKDSTPGLDPLGPSHQFSFVISPSDLTGNLITWAHTKTIEFAESDLPNLNGVGTHKGCADLAGAVVV